MTMTATLVFAKPNHLRYLIAADTGSGEGVSIGGDTLIADSVSGPIKQIANVKTQGYGLIAAGATITQAIARALLQSDDADNHDPDNPGLIGTLPTAILKLTGTTGTGIMLGDANQDSGDPQLPAIDLTTVTAGAVSAYLDIIVPDAIGA